MTNQVLDFKCHSYILPSNITMNRFNIHIYYKNMNIKWVLENFSLNEIDLLSEQILNKTKHVSYNYIQKIFICKNKWDWKKIEKILLKHYFEKQKKGYFPNDLLTLSIKNFISNSNEWENC